MRVQEVIRRPLLTEKSEVLRESHEILTFEVDSRANKIEIQRAVEEFSLNQEEFLKKIEKTMNILKQLQMEMKLDELAKRAEQLLEKQQDVNKNIEDAAEGKPSPEEAAAEADLQKEMQAFENEFKEAQETLKDSPYNPE